MIAVTFRVVGRVQGVWFRAFTRKAAERLGVSGWVRNDGDGSVVGRAEGPEEAVNALIDALRDGPPAARVDALEVDPATVEGARGFSIR